MRDLINIFSKLKELLKKHSSGLDLREAVSDSQVKQKKEQFHLYGNKIISILGRKPQCTYVAGIIMQKHFVGFYSMPMYSHPHKIKLKNPDLIKMRKGKSCINMKKLDSAMLRELDEHVKQGIALYKKEGWI